MSSTPVNIAADAVKDPLPSVVDGDMGKRVHDDELNKDTNTNINDELDESLLQQANNMASMAENMASMMDMMKCMQREILSLSKKCDGMEKTLQKTNTNATQIEKSIQTLPKKQNTNIIISRLDSMEKSMQGEISILSKKCSGIEKSLQKTHTKCTQMEKAIKSLDKKHFSMHCDTQKRLHDMRIDMDDIYYSVEKKLKYHETLLKNQKWKYSAPRPPYEYWEIEIYDDQAEEEDAETFLREIENVTNQLRNGTSDGFVSISAVLPYNEVFLPHWKEFANALEQYQYHPFPEGDNESNLQLWNVKLPVTVVDLLSKALESTWFHKFELRSNNMGQEGINFALDYLKHNLILKQFKLYDNPINNMKDIHRLSKIIRRHPSIEDLTITGYRWHERTINTYQMSKAIMNAGRTKLTTIHLSNNNIRTGGGTFISTFLAKNPILENLHIKNNHLNDNDATNIANALKINTKLLCLNISGNDLSSDGWEALSKAVFDKTSLNSAADSNHNCTIDFPKTLNTYQEVKSMNGSHPDSDYTFVEDYVREKKIYNILSARNRSRSNVEHFEDVPFELFPDMIVSIEEYSDYHIEVDTPDQDSRDVHPLSIVYEICRNWEECLAVFESLSS